MSASVPFSDSGVYCARCQLWMPPCPTPSVEENQSPKRQATTWYPCQSSTRSISPLDLGEPLITRSRLNGAAPVFESRGIWTSSSANTSSSSLATCWTSCSTAATVAESFPAHSYQFQDDELDGFYPIQTSQSTLNGAAKEFVPQIRHDSVLVVDGAEKREISGFSVEKIEQKTQFEGTFRPAYAMSEFELAARKTLNDVTLKFIQPKPSRSSTEVWGLESVPRRSDYIPPTSTRSQQQRLKNPREEFLRRARLLDMSEERAQSMARGVLFPGLSIEIETETEKAVIGEIDKEDAKEEEEGTRKAENKIEEEEDEEDEEEGGVSLLGYL